MPRVVSVEGQQCELQSLPLFGVDWILCCQGLVWRRKESLSLMYTRETDGSAKSNHYTDFIIGVLNQNYHKIRATELLEPAGL